MLVENLDSGFWIRLVRGEKIQESLQNWAQNEGIGHAFFHGLGALEEAELGYYELATKEYHRKLFPGEAELVSLNGNLSILEGKSFAHSHVALGDKEFRLYGGHLFEAKVAVTVEIYLHAGNRRIERKMDSSIGLNLLDLCPYQQK